MPAKSQAQANLMRAAEHGASFPMAKKLRGSMTLGQMHDFAVTKSKSLPVHVKTGGRSASKHPARNLGSYHHPKGGY